MSPLDYVKQVKKNLLGRFDSVGQEIKNKEKELDELVAVYAEIDKLLTEYDEFIDKNEVASADGKCDTGVLLQSSTEDVRQPSTESRLP